MPEHRVREVRRPAAVAEPFAGGWLCFVATADGGGSVRRRIAPIPPDGVERSEAAPWVLLEQAVSVAPRERAA